MLKHMAEQDTSTHTPHRAIRVPDGRWAIFAALAGVRDRARVVNEFIRWYIWEPGAELPERPDRRLAEEISRRVLDDLVIKHADGTASAVQVKRNRAS